MKQDGTKHKKNAAMKETKREEDGEKDIYIERERERRCKKKTERERERETLPSFLCGSIACR